MRYVIYGAGAVGCSIGAEFFRTGKDVLLIARGAHLDALRESGLHYESRTGKERFEIATAADPAEARLTDRDCVILCMKSQHTLDALLELSRYASPDMALVCAQNGVENERLALRFFRNIYGMVVRVAPTFVAPAEVSNPSFPSAGILDLGRYPDGVDSRADAIAADLSAAGFSSRAVPDIMRWKYAKLLQNMSTAVEAIFAPSPDRTHLAAAARQEAEACLQASGAAFTSADEFGRRREGALEYDPKADGNRPGGSAWQSLARQTGSAEVDFTNGEIVLLGRTHNFPTPVNDMVQKLMREMAVRHAKPGTLDAAEAWRSLESARPEAVR
jgi:2-dehydropantoate 2-reductase